MYVPNTYVKADVSTSTAEGVSAETHPGTEASSLVEVMRMRREEWDAYTRGSAMRRAGYSGQRRNVAIAIGNWLAVSGTPDPEAVGELMAARSGEDSVVAEGAAEASGLRRRYERSGDPAGRLGWPAESRSPVSPSDARPASGPGSCS